MAILNISQFPNPTGADGALATTDLVHIGRPSAAAGQKDVALTGEQIFNSVNILGALYGTPSSPTSLTANVVTNVAQFPDSLGIGSPNEVTGSFTIATTAIYRINMLVTMDTTANNQNYSLWIRNSITGDQLVSGLFVPNGAGTAMTMSANILYSMTAGDVINMGISSDAAVGTITFHIATFDITPTTIL